MKTPYLDSMQRLMIAAKTTTGAMLNFKLALEKFKREVKRSALNDKRKPLKEYLASIYPYTIYDMSILVEDCKMIKGSYPTKTECKKVIEIAMGNKITFAIAAAQFYAR